jgi:hypothetical protein
VTVTGSVRPERGAGASYAETLAARLGERAYPRRETHG